MAAEADGLKGAALFKKSRAAALWRLPRQAAARIGRQAGARLGWGVADQAVSSLTNFAVTIYVARTLGATQFGAFSLAYVTYAFVLNASRGLATDPLVVRFSGTDVPVWRRAVASATGTATVVGLAAGICVLAAAAVLTGTARAAFLALGLTLPGLMLQDSWRYSFFALGRGSRAFLNDLVWAVALAPSLLLLRVTGHADVFWYVFIWGAAATVAAAVGPLQARVIPRLSRAPKWLSQQRDLGPRYFVENTSNSGASQLRTYGVGLILGLAAVGYIQAASTLMGPFLVVFMGMSLVTVPEAARVLRRAPHRLRLFCVIVGVGLSVLALAWGVLLLLALPRGLGDWLLGPIWRPTYPLILPLTFSVIGACLIAGASAGLHALGAARRSMRAMLVASAAYLAFGVAGAWLGGTVGAVRGAALATLSGALLWWWELHLALRKSGDASAGDPPASRRAAGRHRMSAETRSHRRQDARPSPQPHQPQPQEQQPRQPQSRQPQPREQQPRQPQPRPPQPRQPQPWEQQPRQPQPWEQPRQSQPWQPQRYQQPRPPQPRQPQPWEQQPPRPQPRQSPPWEESRQSPPWEQARQPPPRGLQPGEGGSQ
jgi:O-antigen/teichoic acid export membrane protein